MDVRLFSNYALVEKLGVWDVKMVFLLKLSVEIHTIIGQINWDCLTVLSACISLHLILVK